MTFTRLYTRNDFPDTDEEVIRDISTAIRIRDYELEWEPSRRVFKNLADGISVVLYRCPVCGTVEGLHMIMPPRTNAFECTSCFSSWKIDPYCRITPLDQEGKPTGDSAPLYEIYRRIKAMPLRAISSHLLPLTPGEELYLMCRPLPLLREGRFPHFRHAGYGRLFLTNRRLVFRSKRQIVLEAPLSELQSINIEPGNKLHFMHRGVLYRLVFGQAGPLKWQDAVESLLDKPIPTDL